MIHQIANVKTKTEPLPTINRDLLKVRHIQAQLKERVTQGLVPDGGLFWSPIAAAPYFVPVSRRIE